MVENTEKTLIAKELCRYNIDIAAISETRFADAGELHKTGYPFYWTTCAMDKKGTSGVGFAFAKRLIENIIESPKAISDRLMKMRIFIQADNNAFATVFSVHAPPTLPSSDTAKERFYEELCCALRAVSTTDKLIVLGDFNARAVAITRLGTECWEVLDEVTAMLMENCFSLCVQSLTSLSPTATSEYPTSGFTPGKI